MSLSVETLAVARKYTDDSLAGAGAVAGVPCKIQSITAITGGNRVTFLWTDNNGDDHTSAMDVMNGADGEDGKGIQSVTVNAQDHLIITYTDGTTVDAGQIEIHNAVDSVNGQTGAVVLDAEDVGALPDNTPIPSKTSDLTNDSGFATTSDVSTALADYTTTVDLTTLLAAKQNTLTFDNAPTENSNNPVKSGGVYSALTTINQTLTNNINVNGSKNICPYELTNWSDRGITITDSADGNYKILNGTCTGNPLIISLLDEITPYPIDFMRFSNVTKVTPKQLGIDVTKKYVFSRQSFDNVRFSIYLLNGDGTTSEEIILGTDPSVNSIEIDFSTYTFDKMFICAKIGINSAVSNYALKPMLCLKSDYDLDDTWTIPTKNNHQLTQDSVTWDNLSEVGAVNYLENKGTTQVDATTGLTFTVNDDKSVTVSATSGTYPHTVPSAKAFIFNSDSCDNLKDGKVYRLSGCPSGGGNSSYYIAFYQNGVVDKSDQGNGYVFAKTASMTSVLTQISIKANAVLSSAITFYPMIAPVSYNGPYVPYAKTNRELTDDGPTVKTINVTAESGISFSSSTALKQCGKNVILNFQTTLSIAANTEALLFTLPKGSRPSTQLLFPAFNSNDDAIVGFMRIKANGEVSIASTQATTVGTYYGGIAQFFAS